MKDTQTNLVLQGDKLTLYYIAVIGIIVELIVLNYFLS